MKLLLLLIPLLFLSACVPKIVYVDRIVEVKVPVEAKAIDVNSSMRRGAGSVEKLVVIKKYVKDTKATK